MIVSFMFLKYQNRVDAELGTKQKKNKKKVPWIDNNNNSKIQA